MEYLAAHWLDIFTTILGLIYILLEYRASIALWLVGIIMPAMDVWLYWSHGLYGDAGMAVYYTVAAIYGWVVWKFGKKHGQQQAGDMPITFMPRRLYLPTFIFFSWHGEPHIMSSSPLPTPQFRSSMPLPMLLAS